MFVMSGILTITLHSFFSADDGGVSAIQADGNRHRQMNTLAKTLYLDIMENSNVRDSMCLVC